MLNNVEAIDFKHNLIYFFDDRFKNNPTFINDFVLQQYIGLKDKNGKDIYEGDILKSGKNIYVIRFKNCGFVGLLNGKHSNDIPSHMLCSYEFEIIGNIFETKLL